jgi:hypothetical protein
MTDLPKAILNVFAMFVPLFSRPVYKNALRLFVGHILCKGRRTIADILRCLNLKNTKNFSKFHWVLNGAKWNCLKGSKILFLALIKLISFDEEIVINIDSTLERRKGPKIQGLGRHRDAARSTKSNKVLSIGLNWLVSALSLKLPFTNTKWSLPFLSILMPPKIPLRSSQNKKDLNKTSRHKKMTDWACQIVLVIRRWTGKFRKITIVADSAFACFKLAYACNDNNVGFISRLRLDARLYDFIQENPKIKRRRVVGEVLPKLSELAKKNIKEWEEVTVKWYGGKTKKVFILSGKCLWYYIGFPPIAIHWVLIKESEKSDPVALYSTDLTHRAPRMVELYVERWPEEVTFEESRRHLGMETQRQWSDDAIAKTTPIILASFSIITLMGWELSQENKEQIPKQCTSWYIKDHVTFSDVLAYVREAILRSKWNSLIGKKTDQRKLDIEAFIMQAAAA